MESTSAGGADGGPVPGADVLRAAAELRFDRPDLTGALAQYLMEVAAATTDRDGWLAAAGWRIHASAAVGDGRDTASEVLEGLSHWGADALDIPAADRLRIELAVVARDAGEVAVARALLAVPVTDPDPELLADAALAAARCHVADGHVADGHVADGHVADGHVADGHAAEGGDTDGGDEQGAALDEAVATWARVGGQRGEIGAASAALLAAAVARRGGRAERAVGLAVDGLARLDRARGGGSLTPSGHLAAALATEWISALIDAGRPEQAREGSVPVRARLVDQVRSTRQLTLLRLTIARAAASDPGGPSGSDPAEELARAARDAAAADVPDLEHVCRTALGELYESQGRLDAALESIRLAVVADRRNRARSVRFRAALAAAPMRQHPATDPVAGTRGAAAGSAAEDAAGTPRGEPHSPNGHGDESGNGNGAADRTAIMRAVRSVQLPAVPRAHGGTSGAEPRESTPPAGARPAGPAEGPRDQQPPARPVWTADPWATGSWTGAGPTTAAPGPPSGVHGDRASLPTPSLLKAPVDRRDPPVGRSGDVGTGPSTPAAPGRTVSGDALFAAAPSPSTVDRSADPDPDTWLATPLAELDRIWESPAEPAPPSTPDQDGADEDGCVVVLDLARAGQRLPAAAAMPTVQRVARRLADRLPPRSRLRDDGPDAVSVVLPGRDRVAASEWMHRVLPGLVDGLTVDEAASGALLRAAVHDADGVVGAQILQRLDGVRGPATPDPGRRADAGGRAESNGAARGWVPPRHAVPDAERTATGPPDGAAADTHGRGPGTPHGAHPRSRAAETVDRNGTPAALPPTPPAGKHDESAVRPPYLPDGVVVRPGSGGRRHRRDPAPDPADTASPAPQSTEGLGLADLLAGALAAYRGI